MTTRTYTGELVSTTCWCGIYLAIPRSLYEEANRDRQSVYCPLGHTFIYRDTTMEQLRQAEKRVEAERRRADAQARRADAMERSRSAVKGHLTRTKCRDKRRARQKKQK